MNSIIILFIKAAGYLGEIRVMRLLFVYASCQSIMYMSYAPFCLIQCQGILLFLPRNHRKVSQVVDVSFIL